METTLNIHLEILKKITIHARARGISRSAMIIFLLKKAMDDISDPGRFGSLVRYQERGRPEDRHTFHIKLRVDDYEYMLDLRKLLKMSVSLILACSVMKYLAEATREKGERRRYWNDQKADNNRYRNYVLIREMIDSVICWKLFWGFPPSIGQHLQE
jgi:hypothetical protein